MKKAVILLIGILMLVGGIILYFVSNLGKTTGIVKFSPGDKPGLNTVSFKGPYGWKCINYEKSRASVDGKEMIISGKGMRDFPLFGSTEESTNYYPSKGEVENIPLDKDYLFCKPNGNMECYILITKDAHKFELLK